MTSRTDIVRNVALSQELETAIRLIQVGLRELQAIDGVNDFYHLPLLTLANGFERYLKVIVCLRFQEENARFPTYGELFRGRDGHDLTKLLRRVIDGCFSNTYVNRIPVGAEDIAFLRTNDRLHEVVGILSSFGQAARYYNLDLVVGRTPETDSPEDEWCRLEGALLEARQDLRNAVGVDELDRIYAYLGTELTVLLERFARALARLFTIGRLGELAKRNMTYVVPFLMIRDSELGKHDYQTLRRG